MIAKRERERERESWRSR